MQRFYNLFTPFYNNRGIDRVRSVYATHFGIVRMVGCLGTMALDISQGPSSDGVNTYLQRKSVYLM